MLEASTFWRPAEVGGRRTLPHSGAACGRAGGSWSRPRTPSPIRCRTRSRTAPRLQTRRRVVEARRLVPGRGRRMDHVFFGQLLFDARARPEARRARGRVDPGRARAALGRGSRSSAGQVRFDAGACLLASGERVVVVRRSVQGAAEAFVSKAPRAVANRLFPAAGEAARQHPHSVVARLLLAGEAHTGDQAKVSRHVEGGVRMAAYELPSTWGLLNSPPAKKSAGSEICPGNTRWSSSK